MTGLLLVGPSPGGAALSTRAAQAVRGGSAGFADSLRSASTPARSELPASKAPADRSINETQPGPEPEPEPVDTADDRIEPAEGEAAESDDRAADDEPVERERDDADARDDAPDEDDDADAEPAAAPIRAEQRPRVTTGDAAAQPPSAERQVGAKGVGEQQAAASQRVATDAHQAAIQSDDAAAAAQDGAKTAVPGERAAAAKPTGESASARGQQGGPAQAGTAHAAAGEQAGEGDVDGEATGDERGASREATDRNAVGRQSSSGFEIRGGEATRPGGSEAAGRDAAAQQHQQQVADGVRPSSLRVESTAAPARGAAEAGARAEAADDGAAMQAVHRGIGAAVRQRGGSVTIRLSPESLGQVRIEMSIRQGTVDVRFEASTEQARELLTRHADMLRTTLQQRGFGVERIDVSHQPQPTGGSRAGADASADQQHGRRQGEHDAAGGESRGSFDQRHGRHDGWREGDSPRSFEEWRVRVNTTA